MGNATGREAHQAEHGRRPNDKEMLVLFKMQRALFHRLVASPEHLQLLQRYWTSSFRRKQRMPGFVLVSNLWQQVGFSDPNPAADLSPMGELGLQCLVFFIEMYPAETAMMQRGRGGYPFAKTAVAIVRSLSLTMHLMDVTGNPGRFPVTNTLFWQLFERDDGFFQLFALAFLTFEELYCEQVAANRWMRDVESCAMTVVDKLVVAVELKLTSELKKAPLELADLQNLCSNGRHIVNKTNDKASRSSLDCDAGFVSRWSQQHTSKKNKKKKTRQIGTKSYRLQLRTPEIQRPTSDSSQGSGPSSDGDEESRDTSDQIVGNLFAGLITNFGASAVITKRDEVDKAPAHAWQDTQWKAMEGNGKTGSHENQYQRPFFYSKRLGALGALFEGDTWPCHCVFLEMSLDSAMSMVITKARPDRVHPLGPLLLATTSSRPIVTLTTIAQRTLRTLGTVLRNSLLSAAISWLLAQCINQGNVFSAVIPCEQSHAAFLTAKMIWFWLFSWVFTIVEGVVKLLPETFTTTRIPSKLSAFKIFVTVIRAMFVHIVLVVIMSVGVGLAIAPHYKAHIHYKADVYWPMLCYNFILTVTDVHIRHIFRHKTVNGQHKALRYRRRQQFTTPVAVSPTSPSFGQFRQIFVRNLTLVISGLSAGAFVHVASSIQLKNKWELIVFAICSQSAKLGIQAVAKWHLTRRKRTPTLRTMAITVAAPTILVDTQLRTVLLCLDSMTLSLAALILFAIGKTGLRLMAALYMRRQVCTIVEKYPSPRVGVCPQAIVMKSLPVLTSASFSSSSEWEGGARVRKLTALYAAEVYADMHGKYIAMCCAYVIIVCFGSNPRFSLGGNTSIRSKLSTVLIQFGIEVVVDLVAVPLEIRFGVDFERFHRDDTFLAIFMIIIAVVNIHIASGVYLIIH